jgi:hypothetical protein
VTLPINGHVTPVIITGETGPLPNLPRSGQIQPIQIVGGIPAPFGYAYNAKLVWVDAQTVEIGVAGTRSQVKATGGLADIVWDGAISIDVTLNGAGGLDVGAIALNTAYAVYVIGDSTNALPPAGIASLNFSAPAMPDGYDVFRRVAVISTKTLSADIREARQSGMGTDRYYVFLDELGGLSFIGGTTFSCVLCVSPTTSRVRFRFGPGPQSTTRPTGAGISSGGIAFDAGGHPIVFLDGDLDENLEFDFDGGLSGPPAGVVAFWDEI